MFLRTELDTLFSIVQPSSFSISIGLKGRRPPERGSSMDTSYLIPQREKNHSLIAEKIIAIFKDH